MFKKWWFWVIIVVVVIGIIAIASGGSDDDSDQGDGTADKPENGASQLGDYEILIKSCRLATDFEGKSIVIVKYEFTNNSDESEAFYLAFDETVYQDGIGLNECYFADDSANYSGDNQMKEIKPGATLEVEVAYVLNDTTTDIDVEVSELFGLDDKIVKKTFKIN